MDGNLEDAGYEDPKVATVCPYRCLWNTTTMSRSPGLQQLEAAPPEPASDSDPRLESDEKPIGVVSQAQPVLPDGGLQAWCTGAQ